MKIKLIFFATVLLFTQLSFAQNVDTLRLSLVEAVNIAIKNNPQLQSVALNEEINEYKIKEVKSSALPQITGEGMLTDNFSRASQILPGEVFGSPGTSVAVKFGTRFITSGTLQLTQKIFDPAFNVGLKAARESQGLYKLQTFKNKEDLIYNVINTYMQLQMVEQQQLLVRGNIERMKILLDITKAQFREGIIKKVDVDQLRVNYTNLTTQLSNTNNTYVQYLNNLKSLMNLQVAQPVSVTELGAEAVPVSRQLFVEENTDIKLLDYQLTLQDLNTKNIRAGYLPSVSFNANYGYQSQFDQFFKGDGSSFKSGLYSIRLTIPIFDGFKKRNQIAQSKLTYEQIKLDRNYLKNNIENQFQTANNNLTQNELVLNAQQENMKVAEELYSVTKLSYTEGIAPLSELINAENALKEAQSQYLTAMLQMNLAELDLMQTSGQLSRLIRAGN